MAPERSLIIPFARGEREALPPRRTGTVHKVRIDNQSIYLHAGQYADGRLGEIFLTMSKTGTFTRGILDSLAIAVSIGLQYGVPLSEYVDTFKHAAFEPSGLVLGDDDIAQASSIVDWLFSRLDRDFNHPSS